MHLALSSSGGHLEDKLGGGSEPGLETLRRQVKYQLDEIMGEEMIDEVLISGRAERSYLTCVAAHPAIFRD